MMEASFAKFIERYPSEVFAKGQTILLKEYAPRAVYVIESGIVRAYMITQNGAERLVAIHLKGDDIPSGYGLGLRERTLYFYEAYTKCVVRLVPRAAFIKFLRSDPEALFRRQSQIESMLITTFSHIHALEQPRAGDKIAFALLYMADSIGVRLRPYKTRLKLAITQQEMADTLGLTRETIGAELRKLELMKIISYSRKNYVLYMERLKRYLDERS
jgi:CRP-like cAMP-binding protein